MHLIRTAFLFLWVAVLFAITVGSLWPGPGGGIGAYDKVVHFAAYALLSMLTWPALAVWRRRTIFLIALALVAYGMGLEYVQPLFGRGMSMVDALANAVGVFVGVLLARLVRRP